MTMHFGAAIFATDYAIRPDELARELEQRGFESIWLPEHTHIPVSRCNRHYQASSRHRHLPHHRTRHDHNRERSCESRCALGWAIHLWYWRRVERRGDGKPRDELQNAVAAVARAGPRDEGNLDQRRSGVSGEFVNFDKIWSYP